MGKWPYFSPLTFFASITCFRSLIYHDCVNYGPIVSKVRSEAGYASQHGFIVIIKPQPRVPRISLRANQDRGTEMCVLPSSTLWSAEPSDLAWQKKQDCDGQLLSSPFYLWCPETQIIMPQKINDLCTVGHHLSFSVLSIFWTSR